MALHEAHTRGKDGGGMMGGQGLGKRTGCERSVDRQNGGEGKEEKE